MNKSNNINKIIKKLCREIFPTDVFQKGNSRVYLDDNGYYFTVIEFQPYSIKKGTFLNVGLNFLFKKGHVLHLLNLYGDVRVGRKFIEYINDEQFEEDVKKYVKLANKYILKYRRFADINYAKKYISKKLGNRWFYEKSMLYFLTDEQENGRKYYKMFLDKPLYKTMIEEFNYPKDVSQINKDYIMNIISEERKLWHSEPSMKKMKIIENYER